MGKVKLAFVGDLMLGDGFWTLGFGIRSKIKKYGNDFLGPEVQKYLKSHDIVFGNVESAISDIGKKKYSLRSMDMRGEPQTAKRLADWGFTIVNVANNHILEHGKEAAKDTVTILKKEGLKVIGTGSDDAFSKGFSAKDVVSNGQIFTFVGGCLRDEKYAFDGGGTFEELLGYIRSIDDNKRIIIVSMHWGNEFIDRPKREQKRLADKLIEAGAQVILGHHSHVIHGFQKKDNTFVAYSLGNFIFGGQSRDTDWTMILSMVMDNNKIDDISFVPLINDDQLRPQMAMGDDKARIVAEIERRNKLVQRDIDKWDSDTEYETEVKLLMQETSRNLRKVLARNVIKMNCIYWPQVFMRPIQRRLNLW